MGHQAPRGRGAWAYPEIVPKNDVRLAGRAHVVNAPSSNVLPLLRRPLDLLLVVGFCAFAITSFAFDRVAGCNADLTTTSDPVAALLFEWGTRHDPLVAANPPALRLMSFVSAFLFGPFYLVLVWAFVRGVNWIRIPALLYSAMIVYSLVIHIGSVGLIHPNTLARPVFWTAYLPYVIVPGLLAYRMRRHQPFQHN